MESDRFDDFARTVAGTSTRRTLLGLAAVLGLSPLLALAKKRRKKKKKKCKRGRKKCGKRCIAATACCGNADCGFQGACESGVCDCKSGARFCQGRCIPLGDCCSDAECANVSGQTCQNGRCTCPNGQKVCNGACILQAGCCDATDCDAGEACVGNHSCTRTCAAVGPECPGSCTCDQFGSFCIVPGDACAAQTCSLDADCPFGELCDLFDCPGGLGNHCVPVCDP